MPSGDYLYSYILNRRYVLGSSNYLLSSITLCYPLHPSCLKFYLKERTEAILYEPKRYKTSSLDIPENLTVWNIVHYMVEVNFNH